MDFAFAFAFAFVFAFGSIERRVAYNSTCTIHSCTKQNEKSNELKTERLKNNDLRLFFFFYFLFFFLSK